MKIHLSVLLAGCLITSISGTAQITSTFDTNADGWTFLNNGTPVTVNHNASNGNPGGFVATAPYSSNITGASQGWFAPAKFLGTHVAKSYGMNLRFDMQQAFAGTASSGQGDVRIETYQGFAIVFSLPIKPAVAPAWSSYTIKLDETGGWRVGNTGGALATKDDVLRALSNITTFEIRGTYITNANNVVGLDNVVLEQKTLAVAPVVSAISATSGTQGDVITINGSGFNTNAASNTVTFGLYGKVNAVVQSASATQLTVVVPQNASYGPIVITNTATGLSINTAPFTPEFDGGGRIIPASFKPKFDMSTITIESISVADVDGDGWNDLAVTNDFSDRVIDIYRNLGTGGSLSPASFAAKVSFAYTGSSANSTGLFFADLDGDGKLDAITSASTTAGFLGQYITFRNTSTPGTISFEAPEYWRGGTDETPIALVADLDGDGRPEFVAGEGAIPGSMWFNQNVSSPGNIEFGSYVGPVGLSVVNGFSGANAGDLNGDGKPELVVSNGQGQAFDILQNTSTPGFPSFIEAFQFTTNQYSRAALIADMNLDGKNDLIYNTSGEAGFHIRLNTDTDGTLTAADFATDIVIIGDLGGGANIPGGTISIGDINGDGKPDIAASDNTEVGVFENNYSGGAFDATAFVRSYQYEGTGLNTSPTAPLVADLNGDGKPELIVGVDTSPDKLSIYENRNIHAPVIAVNTVSPLAAPVGATVTITGDFFSTTPSQNIVRFGAVQATVLTATRTQLTVSVPPGAAYAPVSVTKDGLTSTYRLPFKTTFSPGVTFDNTHFAPPVNYTLTTADYDIAVGDLNNDGKPDVVADAGTQSYAFRNEFTSGAITSATLFANDTVGPANFRNPALQDFDGDGYLDVMDDEADVKRNVTTGAAINFAAPVFYSTDGALSFGDFNADGKVDVVATNSTIAMQILENRLVDNTFVTTPLSSFSTVINFTRPSGNGGAVVAGDFDGDGFDDAITANSNVDNISIFRNLGFGRITTGSFAPRVDIAVGDIPSLIYSGDFDADGKLDLLFQYGTGTNPTMLTIMHNTSTVGNISFTRFDLTNPGNPTRATIADLDGDGKPEIITTSETGNRFSIFKNIHTTGALTVASFAAPFNTTVTAPRGITTGDLNLDGKPEIIITRAAGLLVVYENLISSIQPPTITSFTPTSGPVGTTVTITGTNFSTTPANNIVYFGATQATVVAATASQLTVTVPVGATFKPITVQVNGLMANATQPFVVTFAGGGPIDNCSFAPAVTIGTTSVSNSPTLADLDGDGKVDVLIPERTNNQASIFRNTSTAGTISFSPKISLTGLTEAIATAVGDVDSDGKPDVVVVNYTNGQLSVYKNQSTPGAISLAARVVFSIPGFAHDVSIADIDMDGKLDLIITASTLGLIVYRNTGTPGVINASTFATGLTFATGANAYPFTLGDLDGDGKLDAVVPNADTYTLSVLRNTSSPGAVSFAPSITLSTNTGTPTLGFGTGFVALGDFDDDSKLDLVAVSNTVTKVSFFRNTSTPGTLIFDPRFDIVTTGIMRDPAISDLNGDGKIDFVVDQGPTESLVFQNTASPGSINASSFNSPILIPRLSSYLNHVGDLDNDGRNDIISTSNNVQVFRNLIGTISPPTITSFSPTAGSEGSTVIISGANFSPSPTNNVVKFFNDVTASTTASTLNSITTTVPVGAITGKISVTVGCHTVVSINDFMLALPPTITSFTPSSGPIGTTVIITGTNFSTTPSNNTVAFNGTNAVVSASTATSITVTVPAGATTGEIDVTVAGNTATSATDFIVTNSEIEIYNAISPNHDDKNAYFRIENIELLEPENTVTIYNRWGSKVFDVENYSEANAFKGLNQNGNELPSGTYFYKIFFKSTGKTTNGFLVLKR